MEGSSKRHAVKKLLVQDAHLKCGENFVHRLSLADVTAQR